MAVLLFQIATKHWSMDYAPSRVVVINTKKTDIASNIYCNGTNTEMLSMSGLSPNLARKAVTAQSKAATTNTSLKDIAKGITSSGKSMVQLGLHGER